MLDRNNEGTKKKELTIRDDSVATAEYKFLRSNIPSPTINVVQLAGGTDVSIFGAFKPEDSVRWIEGDKERAALVAASGKAKENQIVIESPIVYRQAPPADLVILRGAHIPGGDDSINKFYESVDANLAEGGLLVTNHYKHQRDAKHFLQNPNYELVGVLVKDQGKPPTITLTKSSNEEIKTELAGQNNPQRTNNKGQTVDKYSGQTFVFQKKIKAEVKPSEATPEAKTEEPKETSAPAEPIHATPLPEKREQKEPEHTAPVAEHKPAEKAPIAPVKAPEKKKEEKRMETFKSTTETSREWMKSKLKSVQKVLGDLGLAAGSSLWELIGTAGIVTAVATGNPIFLAGLGATAIGAFIGWQTAKLAKPDEQAAWIASKAATTIPPFFPFANIASGIMQFLANLKYRQPANAAH